MGRNDEKRGGEGGVIERCKGQEMAGEVTHTKWQCKGPAKTKSEGRKEELWNGKI